MFDINESRLLFISGIAYLSDFYLPFYIKHRQSTIHLIKSILLPCGGMAIILSVLAEDYDFIFSRILGLIWLYSVTGTTWWALKKLINNFQVNFYEADLLFYQIGVLIFSISLLLQGYSVDGANVSIPLMAKAGALVYTFKLLNAPVFIRRNRDKPLIIFSFFTPMISVGLFILL